MVIANSKYARYYYFFYITFNYYYFAFRPLLCVERHFNDRIYCCCFCVAPPLNHFQPIKIHSSCNPFGQPSAIRAKFTRQRI